MSTVGAYLRISEDPDDTRAGVTRQRQDCQREAERRGWGEVAHWYQDNDVSAWRKTVTRHEWRRMLADIASGAVDRVVVYDLDRLVRQPRDLEDLIDLADAGKVRVAGVSSEIDLLTDAGITNARVLTAMAWKSSADTSRRVKRQKRARAEEGKGPGARYRTYGYTRDFEVVDAEAETVREIFSRAAAGESWQSITNDLNDRGVRTSAGGVWRRSTLASLIKRPGYAGLATFKGEIVGATSYPALVSEQLWQAAQPDSAGHPGFNARVYLLSGVATCGLCHGPMYGTPYGRYACKPNRPGSCGRVTIKQAWLDTAVLWALWPVLLEEAKRPPGPERDHDAELAAVDARIGELRKAHADNQLELADLLPMLKTEREKRSALMREQATYVAEQSIETVAGKSLSEFMSSPLSQQRIQVKRHWQAVVVQPVTSKGRRHFDPSRVQLLDTRGNLAPLTYTPGLFEALMELES